ncbi:MAG: hypothetical protein NT024_00125 [Proteobacteria bacterium]|nr:hypothetical protein [Pseudomonadota bacterium]
MEERLTAGNHWPRINRVVVADERDSNSEGIRLAADLKVDRAPFFVVETPTETVIYTVFLKFVKEVLEATSGIDDARLLLSEHPDLDLL